MNPEQLLAGCRARVGGRLEGFEVGYGDLGWVMYDTSKGGWAVHRKSGPLGVNRGAVICLNERVNWEKPDETWCVDEKLEEMQVPMLRWKAVELGLKGMGAEEFMDVVVLHEAAHARGMEHGGSVAEVDREIWRRYMEGR